MTKTVYIEGERNGSSYHQMWKRWGYTPTFNPTIATVIQFTGGEDVNPALYDEAPHPTTYFSRMRDELCLELFDIGKTNGIPMCGICRGGQFLNIANGGKMFQDSDGHAIFGTHQATIRESGLVVDVTSTHHQIMRPNMDKGIVLLEAEQLGTYKEYMQHTGVNGSEWWVGDRLDADDVESVYYDDTNSLCYQPHPEYCDEDSSCVQTYKLFIREYLDLDV